MYEYIFTNIFRVYPGWNNFKSKNETNIEHNQKLSYQYFQEYFVSTVRCLNVSILTEFQILLDNFLAFGHLSFH